ncbi:SDR family oxidoreductase [Pseudohalocynthiibacter aestuariivivens]|uniref:SDR family oxidoreductase n=1 Tax=Roseovarius pelagicus TaxID=2980108 RepID=A0ABY6D6H3_9RHOB|nr:MULTISPECIES: SDR family NAD(P)-dependent oxidoreductase [Rhodobacterales]QIE46278.1 SDR family oxidoreductase [Pseudohalocynthiibacter aestuariivivens]UXX81746.1 SDR family oxidoreductase [Roseovarius pelagicus]
MSDELRGQRALVTGAAQGIGAGIARALAGAGAEIIAADQRAPDDTVAAIADAGGQAIGVTCDVSDATSVAMLFDQIARRGPLNVAVNAAGILSEAPVTEMDVDEFDRIVAVNLRGAFLIAQGAARTMQVAGTGRIILISSELAYLGRAEFSAYCASKAGVVGLTRSLARELAPDILVNSVAPGPVDTPMLALENMSQAWIDKELDNPLGRVGKVSEISGVVRFLCGPEAGFFTGQTLSPNGGAVMI